MQGYSSLVSIIVVTYNNENDIADCLNSILAQTYQNFEIIVVDNMSSDETVHKIRDNFEGKDKIKLVVNKENTGYSGGNNLGFNHSKGELVVILNPDLVVDRDWLVQLISAYRKHGNDVGIICSNVLLFDKRDTINACGNSIHLTGLVFSRFYMEKECACFDGNDHAVEALTLPVAAPSGASMMISRDNLQRIGRKEPFDERRFSMEYSDIDLAIDFLGHGLLCYVAPKSKVFHKFQFKMNPKRLGTLERGRYMLLNHLTLKTRFLLLPSLFLGELVVWSFIISNKSGIGRSKLARSKLGTYGWLLSGGAQRHDGIVSKLNDIRIINVMSTELTLYDEVKTSTMTQNKASAKFRNMHSLANRFFQFSKNSIISFLDAVYADSAHR